MSAPAYGFIATNGGSNVESAPVPELGTRANSTSRPSTPLSRQQTSNSQTKPHAPNQFQTKALKHPPNNEESAPVTNETVKPKDRKQRLVRKQSGPNPIKYKLWLVGHLSTLVFGSISFVFQILWLPNYYYINSIAYRFALFGAITALTATLSHKFGLKFLPPFSALIAQQNIQYLILAQIYIFTFKSVFKIIPYYLIALLQISAHKKINVVLKQSSLLASIIAYDELFLILYLALRTICFRNTSGYQFAAFAIFYWLRILYNKETGNLFKAIVERLDGKVSGIKNEKVTHVWDKFKNHLNQKQNEE